MKLYCSYKPNMGYYTTLGAYSNMFSRALIVADFHYFTRQLIKEAETRELYQQEYRDYIDSFKEHQFPQTGQPDIQTLFSYGTSTPDKKNIQVSIDHDPYIYRVRVSENNLIILSATILKPQTT